MIIQATDPEVLRVKTLGLDDLYQELGDVLIGGGLGMGGRDRHESRRFGKRWINSRSNELVKLVCTSDLRQIVGTGGVDDVAQIATALYDAYPDVTTAVVVAAIFVRRGLDVVCAAYDAPNTN
jgi:hypothetical protein